MHALVIAQIGNSKLPQADELLDMVADGKLGLKLPDGTWDEDSPGDENKEDKARGKIEILA